MGIVRENADFLCRAAASGASFRRMLTLGRQSMYLTAPAVAELAARYGVRSYPDDLHTDAYADRFFASFLGAESIVSLDASSYESAALVHDLNLPVGGDLQQRFDAVFDGGALEHVFNFPVAIASCMRMLAIGGRFYASTAANNCMGHGFYQFSPELFYRIFAPAFGFEAERVWALESRHLGGEHGSVGPIYSVLDPEALRSRVMVVNRRPLSLFVQARKVLHLDDPFARGFPQQSDYVALWSDASGPAVDVPGPVGPAPSASLLRRAARSVFSALPGSTQKWVRLKIEAREHSLRNARHFVPLDGG